jgi:hypothetical protein
MAAETSNDGRAGSHEDGLAKQKKQTHLIYVRKAQTLEGQEEAPRHFRKCAEEYGSVSG